MPAERLDRVSLYLPPDVALQVLPELTHKTIGELWLNPGADSPEVIARGEIAVGLLENVLGHASSV